MKDRLAADAATDPYFLIFSAALLADSTKCWPYLLMESANLFPASKIESPYFFKSAANLFVASIKCCASLLMSVDGLYIGYGFFI